ncbi:MAG: ABC transporter substrate-binding protein [Rhizobacter sp.]|nr:ABC transporter substrate-binding protein [Chlorobiales bacterium]
MFSSLLFLIGGCGGNTDKASAVPVVGFVQSFEDATIDEARKGFYAALKEGGFEDGKTVKIIYRNAQGDAATLNQILDYFIGENVALLATNTTVPTITAVQKTNKIPVCMMVAPRPDIAGLALADGSTPPNLSGTFETLAYIDTSVALIKQVFPQAKRVGTIFNSSEPNSVNSVGRLRKMCASLGLELLEGSVTSSNETQQVVASLIDQKIDVFFALPDNIIFASFETVYKTASDKKIPIVSSEAGLVQRGAFIAYGADLYLWGKQAGESAVKILKGEKPPAPDEVRVRKRIYSQTAATLLGLTPPQGFEKLK